MKKHVIGNSALFRFCQNLTRTLREDPELGLDLSDPDHCGLLRMVDIRLRATGAPFRDGDPLPGEEDAPYDVREWYAMMPMGQDGRYLTPAPRGDETDPDWMRRNQRSLTVSGDGIETDLSLEQLDAIYTAAQNSRLYAVIPGRDLGDPDLRGGILIGADASGEIELAAAADYRQAYQNGHIDRDKAILVGVVSSLAAQNAAVIDENNGDQRRQAVAETMYKSAFWGATFCGRPHLTKQEISHALQYRENAAAGLGTDTTEEYLNYAVFDRGTVRPLFTPDELLAADRDGTKLGQLRACAELWTAAQEGTLFYRDPQSDTPGKVLWDGRSFRAEPLETFPETAKPGAYGVKTQIRRILPGAFPDVAAYEDGVRAAAAKSYYASQRAKIDSSVAAAKKAKEEETRRRQENVRNYYIAQDHAKKDEAARKRAEEEKNRKNAPKSMLDDLGLTDSDVTELVRNLETANGPLPEKLKDNIRSLFDKAGDAVTNLSGKSDQGGIFVGGKDVKTIVACREVRNLLTDHAKLTPEAVRFFCSENCVENCMQLATVNENVKYAAELPHTADFFRKNVLDDEGCDTLAGKLGDSLQKAYLEKNVREDRPSLTDPVQAEKAVEDTAAAEAAPQDPPAEDLHV